ncbi:phospho-N-acetylmuramoyl-pentapeptide-transferase [Propionicicella superfundia]|uniref:phospho-N-acetylmuramoyl-pentapeptide- transferase n=1 Tax=Propionicicella superfundia TaxID=348582 RepID=UPI0004002DCF|nr:phospho-N-acetylmuramoyl-pentapeptide-transferase [Propionicicella superfundia]
MLAILIAGGVAMLATLLGTRLAIGVMVKHGYGQFIREDGPTTHQSKRGTPTMGGIVIVIAVFLGYFVAHLALWTPPTASSLLVLFLFGGLAVVGFLDDFLKLSREQSLGLGARAKLAGQIGVGVLFGVGTLLFPDERGVTPGSSFVSGLRDIGWLALPPVLAVIWMTFLSTGLSNAVNLTDGLDGLATGTSAMVFGGYTIITIWQYGQSCGSLSTVSARCYEVRDPYDLAVVALALAGACFGFLWWNAAPAKIFMGDTGSLALGGALAGLAVTTRTELLSLLIGGLFVIITMSVMLQVGYFKLTKGKRLFKMAPLQHHFELLGWSEITIVIRFWIIAGLCMSIGLGLFYAEWVAGL